MAPRLTARVGGFLAVAFLIGAPIAAQAFTIGGTVSGLSGQGLTLRLNHEAADSRLSHGSGTARVGPTRKGLRNAPG